MATLSTDYIENEYEQLTREWKCAQNEDERWALRTRMARLERTAGELYGTDYMDFLHTRYIDQMERGE